MEHKDETDGNNKPPALENVITKDFNPTVHYHLLEAFKSESEK